MTPPTSQRGSATVAGIPFRWITRYHATGDAARRVAYELGGLLVRGVVAVAEVQASDVHARLDHAREHLRFTRGGTDRGDDLGAAVHGAPDGSASDAARGDAVRRGAQPAAAALIASACAVSSSWSAFMPSPSGRTRANSAASRMPSTIQAASTAIGRPVALPSK